MICLSPHLRRNKTMNLLMKSFSLRKLCSDAEKLPARYSSELSIQHPLELVHIVKLQLAIL